MFRQATTAAIVAALIAAGLSLVVATPAGAGAAPVLEVAVTNDELDPNPGANLPDLSLREAVSLAATDGASSTIVLGAGLTYELTICGPAASQEDVNVDGDLDHVPALNHGLGIVGESSTIRQTCPGERVLHHLPSSALALFGVTVTGGDAAGDGGGVNVSGSGGMLFMTGAAVVDNHAAGMGGGISSTGIGTTLTDSTVAGNEAGGLAGGVHSPGSTQLDLRRTTVSHNTGVTFAGGIYAAQPQVVESTIVANRVLDDGGAIGANLVGLNGASFEASIVALGSGATDCATFGTFTSPGPDLDSDGSCFSGPSDLVGEHPQLGPLADNGGFTETHRPAVGSPVFDVIMLLDCLSSEDQRGEDRPQPTGGSCDLGSVEAPAASCTPPAFPDVGASHPFFEDVCWMDQMGITTGFPSGAFQPGSSVTRQSMAAFIYRFALSPPFEGPSTPSFSDVGLTHPFFREIEWLTANEIASGFGDGSYRPSATVSRQAMAAFIFRIGGNDGFIPPATPTFSDVSLTHPFFREIEWTAGDAGVSTGFSDGTWRPASPVTRQAMSAFLHRLAGVPFLQGL